MKTVFLRQSGGNELLIFFNGWSRDASDVSALSSPFDVLEVHDYSDLNPDDLFRLMQPYSHLHLAAWSLGVWAAAAVFEHSGFRFESALAINGTLYPVHPEYGIAPDIFDGTISNWPDAGARDRFLRRMAGSGLAAQLLPKPERSPEDQQNELIAIRKQSSEHAVPANPYTKAVLGQRDRIIPFASQKRFWAGQGIPAATADLPHYPFGGLSSWEEVLNLGNPR